jgi:hypothetical protein
MYYQLNVSKQLLNTKRSFHVFTTAPNTAVSKRDAMALYALFRDKFPEEEGYRIDVSYVITKGEIMTDDFHAEYEQDHTEV